jgi:hypothetical protein
MHLDFAILAEKASVHADRFFVHGGGRMRIEVPTIPYHAPLAVVARFLATPDEAGTRHNLTVVVHVPDETGSTAVVGPIEMALPQEAEPESRWLVANMDFEMANLPLPVEGWYAVELVLDDESIKRLEFKVTRAEGVIELETAPAEQETSASDSSE